MRNKRHEQRVRIADARLKMTVFIEQELAKEMPDLTVMELASVLNEISLRYINDEIMEPEKG